MRWMICRWGLLVIWCCSFCFNGYSQDLFDYENSRKYADYLYEAGRYAESVKEYNRVVFVNPMDSTAWIKLLIAYQHNGQFRESLVRLNGIHDGINASNIEFGKVKTYALFSTNQFQQLRSELQLYPFSEEDRHFLMAASYGLNGQWQLAKETSSRNSPRNHLLNEVHSTSVDALSMRRKSPFVAGMFSSLLPGMGKVYTGRWKDGLFSLLLFTTTAYQAYRIISDKGIERPGAWIFGGLAIGFYSGNVYGSVKSARVFNKQEESQYEDRVQYLLDIYFGR